MRNIEIVGSEEWTNQHKLLVCDVTLSSKLVKPPCIPPRRKALKLKEPRTQEQFTLNLNLRCQGIPSNVHSEWEDIKSGLSNGVEYMWMDKRWSSTPQGKLAVE